MYRDPLFSTASEKTRVVVDFLLSEEDDHQCLILVGAGGSGKSLAINAAIAQLRRADTKIADVCVWNEGELPGLMRMMRMDADTTYSEFKWIACRSSVHDELTRGLMNEWRDRSIVVFFDRGTETEDLAPLAPLAHL